MGQRDGSEICHDGDFCSNTRLQQKSIPLIQRVFFCETPSQEGNVCLAPDSRAYCRRALKTVVNDYLPSLSAYLTGMGLARVTGTAVTLFCGLPSMSLSE